MPPARHSDATSRPQATRWPARDPARVVLLLDNLALAELVELTLNHGVYSTRKVVTADQAIAAIDEWHPHLVIFDADIDGQRIMQYIAAGAAGAQHLPAIALSRRGDLRTKLAAFEWAPTTS